MPGRQKLPHCPGSGRVIRDMTPDMLPRRPICPECGHPVRIWWKLESTPLYADHVRRPRPTTTLNAWTEAAKLWSK